MHVVECISLTFNLQYERDVEKRTETVMGAIILQDKVGSFIG